MATSYADYLKTIKPEMLNSAGRFLGPGSGVNFLAEGMTPEQFYKQQAQVQREYEGRSDYSPSSSAFYGSLGTGENGGVNPISAAWREGAIPTGSTFQGKSSIWGPLSQFIALAAGGGAFSGAGAGAVGDAGFSGMGGAGGSMGAGADFGLASGGGSALGSAAPAAGGFSFGVPDAMSAGVDIGSIGTTATSGSAPMTLAEQYAAYGGGGGGITGGLTGGAGGTFTGAAGGDLVGTAAGSGGGLFDTMVSKGSDYLSDPSNWLKIGGTLLGAAGGAAAGGDKTTTNSSNRDPWAPAQPYLLDNLKTNAAAQEYYRANPFSDLQKQQYQGLFDSLANNSANMPALMANANAFSQSRRGAMPAMQGLISGTQAAPINWAQYQNIGRK